MQKRAHFVAAVVEDQRAPLAMLALARIGVFIERGSVKMSQPVRVFREVAGNPVDDHADAGLVAAVDEIHEVLGRAEADGGRVIADDLIAPRAGERMLHDGQQFQVRVVHTLGIFHQLVGQLAITQIRIVGAAQPGAQMHFVDRDRLLSDDRCERASPSTADRSIDKSSRSHTTDADLGGTSIANP